MAARSDDPARELGRAAAVRDLVAGLALIGLGVLVGGTSLDGQGDGFDHAFDTLALFWIAWALVRLVRPRVTSADRPPA